MSSHEAWAVGSAQVDFSHTNPLAEHWDGRRWQILPTPSISEQTNNVLAAVAAVSARDVWAVGSSSGSTTAPTLVEHWDGRRWSIVPAPPGPGNNNSLTGVAAVSARDVWAVGEETFSSSTSSVVRTLVEHWDGVHWQIVPSPDPSGVHDSLASVAAVSANDVWAVGSTGGYPSSRSQTLVEHWDGTRWWVVPCPDVSGLLNTLTSVAAVSARDAWAVGYTFVGEGGPLQRQMLLVHWDGQRWRLVPTPAAVGVEMRNSLAGVAAVSAHDVWAVGTASDNTPVDVGSMDAYTAAGQTLLVYWDGAGWHPVSGPTGTGTYNRLYSVTAASARDVWAVGAGRSSYGAGHTLIEHWDGARWRIVPTPAGPGDENYLVGVAVVSGRDIWAVGQERFTGTEPLTPLSTGLVHTLVEHWDGVRWRIVPSPDPDGHYDALAAVAVVSARDAWAVGTTGSYPTSRPQTLVEHWDGTRWTVVPCPDIEGVGSLASVSARSATDVWAVGWGSTGALSVRWDGVRWRIVPVGKAMAEGYRWSAVVAVSARDVWAFSWQFGGWNAAMHWNGTAWGFVGGSYGIPANLNMNAAGAAAVSARDIWVVGATIKPATVELVARVSHWDGRSWQAVPSPNPSGVHDVLAAVTTVSARDVWAVGNTQVKLGRETLVEHWDGTRWRVVPSDDG